MTNRHDDAQFSDFSKMTLEEFSGLEGLLGDEWTKPEGSVPAEDCMTNVDFSLSLFVDNAKVFF